MDEMLFCGSAYIELQGDRALTYLSRNQNYAEYKVNGFEEPTVLVRDYRQDGIAALDEILRTGVLYTFAPKFNTPALVSVKRQNSENILVELHKTNIADPDHRLWMAIGIRDSIPVYDYVFNLLVPWEDDSFSFFALYRRNGHHQGELVFSEELSVAT